MRRIRRFDPTFGDEIARILDERGLSLRGASYKTGIHPTTIGDMRKGVIPGPEVLSEFEQGLGITDKHLLVLAGYEEPQNPINGIENVVVKYRLRGDLTPEKEERIMRYVREIIEEVDGEDEEEKGG